MLTESPQTQAAFEALAKIIIIDYADAATTKVQQAYADHLEWVNAQPGRRINYEVSANQFGVWSIGASGEKGSFKKAPALKPFKEFLRDFWQVLIRARHPRGYNGPAMGDGGDQTVGQYRRMGTIGNVMSREITIFLDDNMPDVQAALGKQEYQLHLAIVNALSVRESTIVHELVHAYDDWISKGKFDQNKRSKEAVALKAAAKGKTGEEGRAARQAAGQAYLNDPIEINARFTQTVKKIGISRSRRVWKDWFSDFTYAFPGWNILPKADKIRLTKRLAIIWTHGRRPERHDITGKVWQLEDKIEQDFKVHLELQSGAQSDVLRCRNSYAGQKMTARVQAQVLERLIHFADIWNRTLSMDEGLFSTGLLQHYGFLANKGTRVDHRFSEPYYRVSPRDKLAARRAESK